LNNIINDNTKHKEAEQEVGGLSNRKKTIITWETRWGTDEGLKDKLRG